ncbi:MAG TPA: hypothetical protein VFO98_09585 [Marmoricola sp.]|jgi:hypothetical protein|nr:hypothetical protein [Marmoricola sp.]
MEYDAASWGALALALSVLGGVITWFRWRRHGLPSLLRGTAWSLLPVAAWLTGVLELVADVSGSVARWAVHLVFSPVVWLGIVLAGVSAALFGASALLRGRREESAAGPVEPAPQPRSVGHTRDRKRDGLEDMDDIDAILRKHGIS